MGQCEMCGKESGKGRTCGSTCRSRLARSVAKANATVGDATVGDADELFCEGVTWDDIDDLPCSKPTVRPDAAQANGPNWWNTPEYAQVIERLLTQSIEQLEAQGVFVPCWVYKRAGVLQEMTA